MRAIGFTLEKPQEWPAQAGVFRVAGKPIDVDAW